MTQRRWLEVRAPHGMVASPHALASASGVATLRAGGNALAAAVAAAATIAVVYPHMNGVGGERVGHTHAVPSAPSSRDAGGRDAASPAGPSLAPGMARVTGAKASVSTAIAGGLTR